VVVRTLLLDVVTAGKGEADRETADRVRGMVSLDAMVIVAHRNRTLQVKESLTRCLRNTATGKAITRRGQRRLRQ
jgi:hypothetical protein